MYISSNIKLLRKRTNYSQIEMAHALELTRSVLNSYENNVANPPVEVVMRIADYFRISLDTLVRVDLTRLPESKIFMLVKGLEASIRTQHLSFLNPIQP